MRSSSINETSAFFSGDSIIKKVLLADFKIDVVGGKIILLTDCAASEPKFYIVCTAIKVVPM